jgi:hypothetical protein
MRGLESGQRAQLQNSHGDAVRNLIGRVAMIEMVGPVLERALRPFSVPVRTLDAIHLSALEFVRAQKQNVQLASYDERLLSAARLLGITVWNGHEEPGPPKGRALGLRANRHHQR